MANRYGVCCVESVREAKRHVFYVVRTFVANEQIVKCEKDDMKIEKPTKHTTASHLQRCAHTGRGGGSQVLTSWRMREKLNTFIAQYLLEHSKHVAMCIERTYRHCATTSPFRAILLVHKPYSPLANANNPTKQNARVFFSFRFVLFLLFSRLRYAPAVNLIFVQTRLT